MNRTHKILEHPADVGIEAGGSTLGEAFGAAAEGLLSLLIEPFKPGADALQTSIRLAAPDEPSLLVRWLSEILYLFDARRFAPAEIGGVQIDFDGAELTLKCEIVGEPFEPARHTALIDVKAVTYHQIAVKKERGRIVVTVFVDI